MEKRESKIKDLVEKLGTGELTPKEVLKILDKQGIRHKESWKDFIGSALWGILCFFPGIAKFSNLEILNFFAQLPAIKFPMVVIYSTIIVIIFVICIEAYVIYWRKKKGGLGSKDDTIILLKEGPFRIVRHPSVVDWTIGFIAITISLSNYVPFTILSVIGNIILITTNYWGTLIEERELNLKNWGNEYRQYMKEVPRFNFIFHKRTMEFEEKEVMVMGRKIFIIDNGTILDIIHFNPMNQDFLTIDPRHLHYHLWDFEVRVVY